MPTWPSWSPLSAPSAWTWPAAWKTPQAGFACGVGEGGGSSDWRPGDGHGECVGLSLSVCPSFSLPSLSLVSHFSVSLSLCMSLHAHMFSHMDACMHACMHACLHIHVCTHACIMCICIEREKHTCNLHTYACTPRVEMGWYVKPRGLHEP